MKLILWDIDGTLVCTGRAGERALLRALKELAGIDGTLDAIDYRGRTDVFIADGILKHYNVPTGPTTLHDFTELYLRFLTLELPSTEGKTHPGILDILEAAHQRDDLAQGLLTGNLKQGAKIKLEHYNVWHYFEFGAFADDSRLRNDLGPFALRRAGEIHAETFDPKDVFIVGDTQHDIECAKVIGANSIAVATGHYSLEELAKFQPTALLPDLGDPAAFFRIIDGV